jgi:hypothetical protein
VPPCALIRGARGDPERARRTSTTPPSAARSARCAHAGASLQASMACISLRYLSRLHQSALLRAGACRRRGARRAWLRPGWRPPALARRWRGQLEGARCGETPARGGTCKGALFFLYSFHVPSTVKLGFKATNFNGTPTFIGSPRPPDPNEFGWKETARMNPGEVTRVLMQFNLPAVPFSVTSSPRAGAGGLGVTPVPGQTPVHEYGGTATSLSTRNTT